MVRTSVLAAAILLGSSAHAQGFINTYGGEKAQDAVGIVQNGSGFHLATRRHVPDNTIYQASFLLLDAAGNFPAWEPYPGLDNRCFVQAMCEGNAGACFIAGSIIPVGESNHNAWVAKLNSSGGLLWNVQPTLPGDEQYFAAAALADGGAVAAGVRANGYGHDAWATRFATDGTVMWSVPIESTSDEEAYAIAVQGNDIMLTGRQVNFGGTTDAWFARLDMDGNVLMTTSWGGADDEEGRALSIIGPGAFLMAGSTGSYGAYDTTEQRIKEAVYLLAIDLNGDTLWTRAVGDTLYDRRGYCMDLATNGDVLIGGERSEVRGESDALVYRLNTSGTPVWERAWDLGKEERLLTMLALSDGLIAAGWTFDPQSRQVLLVRRDPDGN